MSVQEIDGYLDGLDEPKRGTLEALRRTILGILPDAEQGLAYGVPAFMVNGAAVAGFAAAKAHLSYYPHSGSVISRLTDELVGYDTSRGTLRFPVDTPLPAEVVRKLLEVRLRELG